MIEDLDESNVDDLLGILASKPLANITMIADCTQLKHWCDIRLLKQDGKLTAAFSLYHDLDFLAGAFWAESSASLHTLLRDFDDQIRGQSLVIICNEDQLKMLSAVCDNVVPIRERQMIADNSSNLSEWGDVPPEKLSPLDADDLRKLYINCGIPAWTPSVLELGPFYGIRDVKENIVCVAGVHYVTRFGAEIGNVATLPDFRRRGLASSCIRAVAEELLDDIPIVVLHYFDENRPAQLLYERMGFSYSDSDPVYFTKVRFD
ncbi:MAG: GNAT family N-acetyltransferase [Candidatus Thorarchaeota archaeon]|nr:GNAT family N-acetyltransferase [Candidatus Thorarchaeota archaeon]